MSLQPFLDAPTIIQIHALCATTAVVTGPVAIYRKRRDRLHKYAGYVWVVAMATVALSAFGIHSFPVIGPFSPIHLLACLALWSLVQGMRAIIRGDVATHEQIFRSLYWNGLMIAALFNFLPGRATQRSIFGETSDMGFVVIAVGGALLLARVLHGVLQKRQFKRSLA